MASLEASKSSAENEGPAFSRFNQLPWEIRRMVWEHALPAPIPQVLIYKPTTFPKWNPKTKDWDATDGPPTIPILPPAILHATQESRDFALEHVVVRKSKKYRTRSVRPDVYHHIVSRPFNRDIDALFVHQVHFRAFTRVYMATTPWAARHLLFDDNIFDWDGFELGGGWFYDFPLVASKKCRSLRSASLVRLGRCDSRLDNRAKGDYEPRGCYRAVRDMMASDNRENLDCLLENHFQYHEDPNYVPPETKVGINWLCGAAGEGDDKGFLECSQVVLERLTDLNVPSDRLEWSSGRLFSRWETWAYEHA